MWMEVLHVMTLYPVLQVWPASQQPLPAVDTNGYGNFTELLHRQLTQGEQQSPVQLYTAERQSWGGIKPKLRTHEKAITRTHNTPMDLEISYFVVYSL